MNTDKIIAEKIASEYAPKKTSKVVALKKWDRKAKQTAEVYQQTLKYYLEFLSGVKKSRLFLFY